MSRPALDLRSRIQADAAQVRTNDPAQIDRAVDLALKWCEEVRPYVDYIVEVKNAVEAHGASRGAWLSEHKHRIKYVWQYAHSAPDLHWHACSFAQNMDGHRRRNDPKLQNDPRDATGYFRGVMTRCCAILTEADDALMMIDFLLPDNNIVVGEAE